MTTAIFKDAKSLIDTLTDARNIIDGSQNIDAIDALEHNMDNPNAHTFEIVRDRRTGAFDVYRTARHDDRSTVFYTVRS